MTNRMLAAWVKKVALSFEETRHHLGGRGEVTGNPIRADFGAARRKTRGEKCCLLVFGGSQGARAINDAVIGMLPHLKEQRLGLSFVHGTGTDDLERVRAAYAGGGFEARVDPYIGDIRTAYEQADLVLARSGASTMSEIAACGKASILVPLPTAAHDHQRVNARLLEAAGAAIVLEETDLSGEALARAFLSLMRDPGKVTAMERAAASQARPEAAGRIADMVEELIA
jgi:UDP-N-acetylglucosamine--N-acetylmuramyl-(pentapeptide) pyrophosphoryl-undecaprenol N-acetylglucosamine transferase